MNGRYGADCGAYADCSGYLSVYSVVNAVPGFEDTPEMLVSAAVNNLAAAGASPAALLVSAAVPAALEESSLKSDMARIGAAAAAHGMAVLAGHTQVAEELARPWYSVTGIGKASRDTYRGDERLRPGQELVLTKWIALAGTAALARQFGGELGARYPFIMIDRAREFFRLVSVAEEARAATHFGPCAMHDLSQGGVFGALWEMAERAGVGLEVDLKKIPIRQETVEICEYFDINPYYFYSAGALLIGTDHGMALAGELASRGIPAAVIGSVTGDHDRIIRNGGEVRYLDRPQQEEWYRRFAERNRDM